MSTPRRNSYAVSFKVSVVEWQRKNEASIHRTAKYFSIDRKRVCDGEKERSEGRPVSNQLLKTRAIQIAGGLKIAGFRASCGWLSQWKQWYNVGVRAGTNNAQKIPADYADLLHSFRKSVITIRKAENIGPADIVNMDQTMCRFDMPPSHTNNKRGERTIRIKTTRAEKKIHCSTCSDSLWKETASCDCVQRTWRITGGACSAESSHFTQRTSESLDKWLDDSGRVPTLASSRLWEGVSTPFVDRR